MNLRLHISAPASVRAEQSPLATSALLPAFKGNHFIWLLFAQAMSHAGQCLNTARRVLAHVRAYLDIGQYGERRDTERRVALRCVGMARSSSNISSQVWALLGHLDTSTTLLLLYNRKKLII